MKLRALPPAGMTAVFPAHVGAPGAPAARMAVATDAIRVIRYPCLPDLTEPNGVTR